MALAQVLIREPRLVVLDEPTGTMDPITKLDVKHSILHSRDEMEETFIVVSHDMEFVREVCDRLALMRGGKIVSIGKTAEVLAILTEEEREVMSKPASSRNRPVDEYDHDPGRRGKPRSARWEQACFGCYRQGSALLRGSDTAWYSMKRKQQKTSRS